MRVFMQISLVGAQGCKVRRKVTHSPHECGPIAAYMGLSKYIHVYIYMCFDGNFKLGFPRHVRSKSPFMNHDFRYVCCLNAFNATLW